MLDLARKSLTEILDDIGAWACPDAKGSLDAGMRAAQTSAPPPYGTPRMTSGVINERVLVACGEGGGETGGGREAQGGGDVGGREWSAIGEKERRVQRWHVAGQGGRRVAGGCGGGLGRE